MKYIDNLVEQFIKAEGITKYDLDSKEFLREFSEWLKERQMMGKIFTSLLDEMEIKYNSFNTAEVGKTSFDSICKDYSTTIITPYVYGFERRNNLFETPFYVDMFGNPIIHRHNNIEMINTYMTYNPYEAQNVHNWDKMHNEGKNIIVGIFGSENDKDIIKKSILLDAFIELLDEDIITESTIIDGAYCKVIASKR